MSIEPQEVKMKLYEVPRNTKIVVDCVELMFHHIDGLYSYCTDASGDVHHIAAYTEVTAYINTIIPNIKNIEKEYMRVYGT